MFFSNIMIVKVYMLGLGLHYRIVTKLRLLMLSHMMDVGC